MQRAGFVCVVEEPGSQAVTNSRKRGLSVIEAAFQVLDIPKESIPTVGLIDVLEHIENDIDAGRYRRYHL